ncbi:MAG: hypothetical protein GC205_03445 [Bacteroidetes bacterium]|nr:hypothetical protein [Bacteroidota bacterium]
MSEKLKILTDKIYEEGVFKAREESEKMLRHAEQEAARIREEAERERTRILEQARAQAEAQQRKTDAELRMAARKAIAQVQEHLNDLITEKALTAPLAKGLDDHEILARAMEACAGALTRHASGSWTIALQPEQLAPVEAALQAGKHRALAGHLVLAGSGGTTNGFEVFPDGQGYSIRFDQHFFTAFFSQFLSVETRGWLAASQAPASSAPASSAPASSAPASPQNP